MAIMVELFIVEYTFKTDNMRMYEYAPVCRGDFTSSDQISVLV